MVNLREATKEDILLFSTKLRDEDIEECKYLLDMSGKDALLNSFNESKECFVVEINNVVSCLFGCAEIGQGALFWILISKDVERLPRAFFVLAKEVIKDLLTRYKFLTNYGEEHKNFIANFGKWLGFNVNKPEPYGKGNKMYCRFYIERGM
jgi:hypothetical protein